MLKLLTVSATQVSPVLVVMVGARACAFPLHHVAETMRPLPGRIHMSDATRQALIQPFSYEHCGVTHVKDKGEMSTWFLNNRGLRDSGGT